MTQNEKLLAKFLENPTALRFAQIEKILLRFGFSRRKGKGSHQNFTHQSLQIFLIFPVHNGDCKNCYKIYNAKILQKFFLKK
jgi:predicted RNA binding protein YcfA (HicA-like mRNA interferase family)